MINYSPKTAIPHRGLTVRSGTESTLFPRHFADPVSMFNPRASSYLCFCGVCFLIVAVCSVRMLGLQTKLLVNARGFSPAIYDRHGELISIRLTSDEKFRVWAPLSSIAPPVRHAVMAYEDRYFYQHPGLNPKSLLRAAWRALSGTGARTGASTITMQLARLRFGMRTQSMLGKIAQMATALLLELTFTKDEIFEAYLNLAPFGLNIEGVEAASRIYFGKGASALGPVEAVSLAVVPQAPNARVLSKLFAVAGAPLSRGYAVARERAWHRLCALHPEYKTHELALRLPLTVMSRESLPFAAPHFVERLLKSEGPLAEGRASRTTLDLNIQRSVEQVTADYLTSTERLGVQNATVLLLHNPTGGVRAYLGSARYEDKQIGGQVDGIRARRSPGSALKPFVYALGIGHGLIHPRKMVRDTPYSVAGYTPENFDRTFLGPLSAEEALVRSRNVPALALARSLGKHGLYPLLNRAGVGKLRDESWYGLSLTLGGVEVTLDELVRLYGAIAARGVYRPALITDLAEEGDDNVSTKIQLLSPESAFVTLSMLSANPRPEETYESNGGRKNSIPWKTGTSWGFRDAWAVGIVGEYTLGVWLGNFSGRGNAAFIGRDLAGPLFFRIVDALRSQWDVGISPLDGMPPAKLRRVAVCSISGDTPGSSCPHITPTWVIPGTTQPHECAIHRELLVNRATGEQLCFGDDAENAERRVVEIWPSDIANLFRIAGLQRTPPPPLSPHCSSASSSRLAPRIVSPDPGVAYQVSLRAQAPSTSTLTTELPLRAETDDGASVDLYWFVNEKFLGKSRPGEALRWQAPHGRHTLRVVDGQGLSDVAMVTVEVAG